MAIDDTVPLRANSGAFSSFNRYNFDQVPLPLVCDSSARTVNFKGAKRVWVQQARANLDKRQACQETLRAAGQQPKPVLVFRGLGKRISAEDSERQLWDKRVNVLFQKNAWVDRPTANCAAHC